MATDHDIHDIKQAFADACRDAGLLLKEPPILDGRFHRVRVEGSRRLSGTYRAHLDNLPAGYIRNYRTEQEVRWVYEPARKTLSPAQLAAVREEWARLTALRQAQRDRAFARRAADLSSAFDTLGPADPLHPYLVTKGLDLHPAVLALLRQDDAGGLVVPMRDLTGRLWSAQVIERDGFKRYAHGGRVAATLLVLGDLDSDQPLIETEGFATGATLHGLGLGCVVVAFQANNLARVATALRQYFPTRPLIIAGDNDRFTTDAQGRPDNVGLRTAQRAAATASARYLVPTFSAADFDGTDWNDLMREEGAEAVLRQWAFGASSDALSPPHVDARPALPR